MAFRGSARQKDIWECYLQCVLHFAVLKVRYLTTSPAKPSHAATDQLAADRPSVQRSQGCAIVGAEQSRPGRSLQHHRESPAALDEFVIGRLAKGLGGLYSVNAMGLSAAVRRWLDGPCRAFEMVWGSRSRVERRPNNRSKHKIRALCA